MRTARVAPVAAALVASVGALARPVGAQRREAVAIDWAARWVVMPSHTSDPAPARSPNRDSGRSEVAGESTPLAPRALIPVGLDGGVPSEPHSPLPVAGGLGPHGQRRRARWAPLASAALPGTGQAMLSQHRFLPYLAIEGYAWLQVLADRREGRRQRSAYRGIARTVARARFSSTTPTGDWEYYERMEQFTESGVFDVNPGGTFEPEPDTATYNGSVWLLARQTYWEDPFVPPSIGSPAYESALSFYRQRAVTPEYRWSWRDAELEQDVFRRTIARSNDAYRRAAQDLAVVIANHVLSTVDAYVTVRLRNRRAAGVRMPAGGSKEGGSGDAYGVSVALPLPRVGNGARR